MTNLWVTLCLGLVRKYEGCRLAAYMPTPNDRPTIGWGSTFYTDGRAVKLGDRITQAQADDMLATTVGKVIGQVAALVGKSLTSPGQGAAMACLAYNIGISAFAKSTLLALHKAGSTGLAKAQFARWNKQDGRVLKGLTTRRAEEATLYERI